MFIDESGADLTVTVDGEEYNAEASVDFDSDGVDDTAVVETDDGAITFTDTDADGQADLMTQLDADGDVVGQARFDEATGEWVHVDPADRGTAAAQHSAAGPMTVDTPLGQAEVGAPTHDTDGDGIDDSVVITGSDGDTLILTDADEDGDADYATKITGEGDITVSEHTGPGEWTTIERGHLDDQGQYQRDPLTADSEDTLEESGWITSPDRDTAEVRVDPRTGHWTRG